MNIDVIIPTYNRCEMVQKALNSILAQTLPPSSIWVIDDGSTDNTEQFITTHYPQVNYCYQKNQGVSAARNLGILNSSSEWIVFLDSDDRWLPTKLEQQFLKTTTNNRLWSHTNETWIRNGHLVNQHEKHKKPNGWIYQECLKRCCVSPSTVMIHRSIFNTYGLFDPILPACEDYDLWLRISAYQPILLIKEALTVKNGGHSDQLSYLHWGMDRFRIQSLQKLLEDNSLDKIKKEATRLHFIKLTTILYNGALKRDKLTDTRYYHSLLSKYS